MKKKIDMDAGSDVTVDISNGSGNKVVINGQEIPLDWIPEITSSKFFRFRFLEVFHGACIFEEWKREGFRQKQN